MLQDMGPAVAVLPSAPTAVRNHDVEHAYRQDSDFYYLTGFDEPGSVLVLTNQHPEQQMVLFVRPRDPQREVWDGARAGVEGAQERFGADAAFPIDELPKRLPEYLADVRRVYYRLGADEDFDRRMFSVLRTVRGRARAGVVAPTEIVEPGVVLHEMRLRKEETEQQLMSRAAQITAEAHRRALEVARPGRYEYEVEAEMLRVFRSHGSERVAYQPIVGSGPNATVLHHIRNDRQMGEGDLLLIDAGCEYGYYASDVTRTFPVSGTFRPEQRVLYDLVLEAQAAAIDRAAPGATLIDVHQAALAVLARGMVELGLIEGPVDKAIEEERYKPYFMHRTSHWLGMDVHDVGDYYVDKQPRPLEPGFVFTVEPGIYVATDAEADPKWRGIGIRIEDNVLITSQGCRVLTADIPKEPAELERILINRS